MLLARTDQDAPKHKGITYFILDMEQSNVDVRPLRQITGEAEFNEIFLEEAEVPDENIIGEVGGGWAVAITTLMFERAGLGALAAVMGLKRTMEDLLAADREKGLDEDPVIRQRIGELQIGIQAMRLGALAIDTGVVLHARMSIRPSSALARSTMASRSAREVTSAANHHGAAAEGAHFLGGALGARLVQLGDDDVGTQLRQLERGGAADTAAGAGDDRDLSL